MALTYEPPRHFLLRRQTDAITDEDVVFLERALARQLRDCAYFYGLPAPGVSYVAPDTHLPESEAVGIDLVDDDGVAAAIAHHGYAPGARHAWALVGVRETPEWTVAASHEALEALVNLHLDRWADAPDGDRWAYEICDPVQAQSYPMGVEVMGEERVVRLSNYVLPAFWGQPQLEAPELYDYLSTLPGRFILAPGGYAVVERDGQRTELGAGARRGSSPNQARATARGAALLVAQPAARTP